MSDIQLKDIRKVFGPVVACHDISTTFAAGSLTCLLGPSGCGKTTLLRIIAGLEEADSGEVWFGDENVTHYTPAQRNIGMVFQYPVVYKGLTVAENLELPLRQMPRRERLGAAARRKRVSDLLELLNLGPKANQSVDLLDNGSRQTVAVGRAVVRHPKVVIFDEPVTNVDVDSKIQIQRGIKLLSREVGQTILYVTHDQREAMTLADRMVLLKDGSILENSPPSEAYHNPASTFGGYFLGSPGMNFLNATCQGRDGGVAVSCPLLTAPFLAQPENLVDGTITVGVRPEDLNVRREQTAGAIPARVKTRTLTAGGRWLLDCAIAGHDSLKVLTRPDDAPADGQQVWLATDPQAIRLFTATGDRIATRAAAA
ncbi:MAG: ABC transporter ATP-binding protein [Candidimonas sp.]|nr:MAG: ABC transporter ATP-binding protein [Candidimonas sp.]